MIIDSHVHIGEIGSHSMPEDMLIESMDKYKIDYAVVSNIDANEVDGNLKLFNNQKSMTYSNARTIKFVKKYPNRLKALFWIKPFTEKFTQIVDFFFRDFKDELIGFKFHPYHSNMRITNDKLKPYLEYANENSLVFAVHTAPDEFSKTEYLYEIAQKYENVKFIAVHMDLGSDNNESIEFISKQHNLYGDCTWVSKESVINAIKKCGKEKIMFGTDAPIDGVYTYDKYIELFDFLKKELSKDEFDCFTYKNASELFNIK